MTLSRSSRMVVAWIAGLLLVLCQTAFAGQACAADFARSGTTTANAPCHESAEADSNIPSHAASTCEAAKAVADPVKIPVFSISDVPAVIVAIHAPIGRNISLAIQHVQAVCHSPPLTLLHCRFLN